MTKITYETHVQTGTLLNANECPRNLGETVQREIAELIPQIAFNRYPDNSQKELLEAYAGVMQVSPGSVLAGNGSDQILGYLITSFLSEGKKLYTLDPDFSMYDYYAGNRGASVVKYPIDIDGEFRTEDFIAYGKKAGADLVMFSNPNNPSGICLDTEQLCAVIEAFADIPVVIDEAYVEFADQESAIALLGRYRNLYVTRTLSKAFGLAGLRVGFLVTDEANMEPLRKGYVPYALNTFSMKAACVVLSHAQEILAYAGQIKAERKKLYERVCTLTCVQMRPSQANFLYGTSPHKAQLLSKMAEKGIVIRNYAGKDAFRITIGTPAENETVWNVLKALEEEV